MSESNDVSVHAPASPSPPPAPVTSDAAPDPALELHRLAERLVRGPDRRVLLEYLRLRRTLPRSSF